MAVALLALLIASPPLAAQECPECDQYRQWLEENADQCHYQGARLPSICAADPECVRWNIECGEQRKALDACVQECSMPTPPPESAVNDCKQCGVFEKWLQENAGACFYQASRLGSVCAIDPVCMRWNEVCGRQRVLAAECARLCPQGAGTGGVGLGAASEQSAACGIVPPAPEPDLPLTRRLLPIFPEIRCADCEKAFEVAERLITRRDAEMKPYREVAQLKDEVIRARVYTVTIHSEHGQDLTARLQTRDEDLATMRSVKSWVLKASSILALKVPYLTYAAKRASEIVDLMIEHPTEALPVAEAVAKIEKLHAEREHLIADLEGFQRALYCERVLPYELTLSSLYSDALGAQACPDGNRAAQLRNELERIGQIHWQTIPGESPELPDHTSGRHPQFYTWERLLYRSADCLGEGVAVEPAPIPAGAGLE